jgi:uncharacterized protein (TIGR03435 family)
MSVALQGQVAFDVASVKESKSLADGGSMRFFPDGGVRADNMPARALVSIALELKPYQLENVPSWANAIRYDVEARPAAGAKPGDVGPMLHALLVERFAFKFHRETREVDGFALVRAQRDRLGPQLRVSQFDCQTAFLATPECRQGRVAAEQFTMVGNPLSMLLQVVVNNVVAPVSDETGLTGRYDIDMQWSKDVAPNDDRPSIYTALQDQLGLKLERRRVTTDVVIVDRLERATPD